MALEYVTGAEFILANDNVGISVVNTGELTALVRIIVFESTGGGAVVFAETGVLGVMPGATIGFGVSLMASGFYWISIHAHSDELVPNVHFARLQGGVPVTFASYSPGDFAVFQRSRR
jgi:hypothetical protein